MNKIVENCIEIIFVILAFLALIFGSYLPFIKSQCYIDALRLVPSMKTIQEFEADFDKSFKFYSPIGDEEIAKFLAGNILQIISQQNESEAIDRMLVTYIEPYMFKNDVRHLLALGQMYEILWSKYSHEEDFQKSGAYFQKAYQIGPKLPPVLYSLLNLYQVKGDVQKVKEIGEIILHYWPDDKNVQAVLSQINS